MSARKNTSRELTSGVFTVKITLDANGNLLEVKLPKRVPEGLDADMLRGMLAQLSQFPLTAGEGTPFFLRAWSRMQEIPWGEALTYRELAEECGSPKAVRAAGQACARNPRPLIVPCHRVLANEGLGGFAYGLAWKTKLLELESAQ